MSESFTLEDAQRFIDMIKTEQDTPDEEQLAEYANERWFDFVSAKASIALRLSDLLGFVTPEKILEYVESIADDFESQDEKDQFFWDLKDMINNNDRARLRNIIKGYLKETRKPI